MTHLILTLASFAVAVLALEVRESLLSKKDDCLSLRAYEVDDPEGFAGTKTVMASDAFDAVRVAGKEWAFHHARFRTVTVRVASTREWLTVGHQGGRAVLL